MMMDVLRSRSIVVFFPLRSSIPTNRVKGKTHKIIILLLAKNQFTVFFVYVGDQTRRSLIQARRRVSQMIPQSGKKR